MPKIASGTLLYRLRVLEETQLEIKVLLVHPSGNYNAKAPWSIPKGLPEENETLEDAARRETLEETGVIAGELVYLGEVKYLKSRKIVHCYAGPAPEQEPKCASWEVDRAEYVTLERAKEIIHPDQKIFLEILDEVF